MAFDTLGQHIACIRHTEAATRNINAATETADALRHGQVENLKLSNEQASVMLSELIKDTEVAAWARKQKIDTAEALNRYFSENPEALFANVGYIQRKQEMDNKAELVMKENDMLYGALDPLRREMRAIITESPDLHPDEISMRMNSLNGVFDKHMQTFIQMGILNENDRQEDGIIRMDGGLPGGMSQGEPLTIEHLSTLNFTTNIAQRMSNLGREDIKNQQQKGLVATGMVDLATKKIGLGDKTKDLILENIWSSFPNTMEQTDSGTRSHDDWVSANEELSNVINSAIPDNADPTKAVEQLINFTKQAIQPDSVDFNAKGWGGATVNTYIPSAQLGEFTVQNMYDPGTTTLTRDTYITLLKETLKGMSEEEAQRTANRMFTNMVTSLISRPTRQ